GGLYFDYGYTRPGVISNGPVLSGGQTEGNISDPGAETHSSNQGTPVPAVRLPEDESNEKDDSEKNRPELTPPTAGKVTHNQRFTSNESLSFGDAASGRLSDRSDAQFNRDQQALPAIVTSSGRSQSPKLRPSNSNSNWQRR
ncbi:MAG: hypothetical protein ABI557_18690, partial [Aureliella sp.]